MRADHSGHGGAAHRQGVQPRRTRSKVEYHPGARFDGGRVPSHTPSAQRHSPNAEQHSAATDTAADKCSPAGSGLSAGAASAENEAQPDGDTADVEQPATRPRSVRQRSVAQPKALAHATAPDSSPPDRSALPEQHHRRPAAHGAVSPQPLLRAPPADAARTGARGHQNSRRQAVKSGRPAKPKRVQTSRAACSDQPTPCGQGAAVAVDTLPQAESPAEDSQVHPTAS